MVGSKSDSTRLFSLVHTSPAASPISDLILLGKNGFLKQQIFKRMFWHWALEDCGSVEALHCTLLWISYAGWLTHKQSLLYATWWIVSDEMPIAVLLHEGQDVKLWSTWLTSRGRETLTLQLLGGNSQGLCLTTATHTTGAWHKLKTVE